ncbi:MAG: 16S rRNA (cytosine(1402)-N(4))-methyltransferase RsmH [Actinobacteria bacterium]|nr:16S rRNA (cytosine(1402)-N(4))-methyltransferase RsmH [Actinomycetota bacterium]
MTQFVHDSVMLPEIMAIFSDLTTGVFLDATLGGAGHSVALLNEHPSVSLLGIDQDDVALDAARAVLTSAGHSGRVALRRARFDSVTRVADEEGISSLAGALFDLGVSSPQFDVAERGFSYRFEAPLDMRMDRTQTLSADVVVNTYEVEALADMLRRNADERHAHRIAKAIVAARPIHTTTRLSEVVSAAIPAPARRRGGHPAKRTFQAIRIEVNAELDILPGALRDVIALLAPGARLAVLTYHSGEDRIVKSVMRTAENGDCTCPPNLPCGCGAVRSVIRIRAPRDASKAELARNPRASSARLRVVEKISDGGAK